MKPASITLLAPGHWFVDFGTEVMAGLSATVSGGKAGAKMNVKLSEELLCKGCTPKPSGGPGPGKGCNTCDFNMTTKAILYPMRTNNKYAETWTLADGTSTIENHEYKLFRWGEITMSAADYDADIKLDLTVHIYVYDLLLIP